MPELRRAINGLKTASFHIDSRAADTGRRFLFERMQRGHHRRQRQGIRVQKGDSPARDAEIMGAAILGRERGSERDRRTHLVAVEHDAPARCRGILRAHFIAKVSAARASVVLPAPVLPVSQIMGNRRAISGRVWERTDRTPFPRRCTICVEGRLPRSPPSPYPAV